MTGITRSTAAKVIAGYFHTDATHVGGCYDAYSVRDNDGRMWKIMRDASVRCENRSGQNASSLYSVEFAISYIQYCCVKFFLCVVKFNSVECKKNKHSVRANAFIPVNKSVIFYDSIPKPCSFLLYSWK